MGFILAQGNDDYGGLVEALPSEAIVKFSTAKDSKTGNSGGSTSNEEEKKMVTWMQTLEHLRSLLVHIITIAKSPGMALATSEETYAISDALEDFNWADFKVGTI